MSPFTSAPRLTHCVPSHHVDQPVELGGVGDLVLGLGKDLPKHAVLCPERAQQVDVVRFKLRAVAGR